MLMLPIHAAASSQAGRDMRQQARRRLGRREGGSGHDGPRGCVPRLARYSADGAASPRRRGRAGQGAAGDASARALMTPGRATAGEQGMARAREGPRATRAPALAPAANAGRAGGRALACGGGRGSDRRARGLSRCREGQYEKVMAIYDLQVGPGTWHT